MGEMTHAYRILVRKAEENRPFEKVVDGRIILKETLKKYVVGMWIGFSCLKIGSSGWALVHTVINLRVT
jgi:hypothetical protein